MRKRERMNAYLPVGLDVNVSIQIITLIHCFDYVSLL